ncbi:hypothetical protein [Burkholderia pyrrocinia]|uniref:hypothetical protein n=1 Tax=Burkholderia pyrrocinia TaxID=60550 RepID=UPI001589D319|nr:hypothetical protein [Burkholderia pyrrocinia]
MDSESNNYANLDFGREELAAAMREHYDKLIAFVSTPEFKSVHAELRRLPPTKRPEFVNAVLMQPQELARRGIVVPEGILIQLSAFGDRRPTLFAVKIFLPEKFHKAWENVNITFDNEFPDESVSRAPEKAWRCPLPVELQSAALSNGDDLDLIEPTSAS